MHLSIFISGIGYPIGYEFWHITIFYPPKYFLENCKNYFDSLSHDNLFIIQCFKHVFRENVKRPFKLLKL